jgi:hypothetical protein
LEATRRSFNKDFLLALAADFKKHGAAASALPTNRQSTPWSTAMLAEIYLLKLEVAVRAAKEAATTASTLRFVPVTLPAGKAS